MRYFSNICKKSFTLIELLVTTAQQNCFSKIKKYTSLRPSGRTSRLTQSSSSHLHIFTQSAFTLNKIEAGKAELPPVAVCPKGRRDWNVPPNSPKCADGHGAPLKAYALPRNVSGWDGTGDTTYFWRDNYAAATE